MPSNLTPTRSSSEPRLHSHNKIRPLYNDHRRQPKNLLNDQVRLQELQEITAQDAISMGEAAKNILESRTTVYLARKNIDKAISASFNMGTRVQSSVIDFGIEVKSIGCTAGLQSKNLHPLIREKLQSSIVDSEIGEKSIGCTPGIPMGNLHPLIREKLERIVLLANGVTYA